MSDAPKTRGGFGQRGRGERGSRGARGGPRGGRGARGGRGGRGDDKEAWVPVTKLGRLVKAGLIKSMEEVFQQALPVKEWQLVDSFFGEALKDEVMKIMPVQKQTTAGQRTRFKAFVVVGDFSCHVGLGVKTASEVATAIRGAIWAAKTSLIPVRRGYWGGNTGKPHTVPTKVTGQCGSVRFRIIPAPRGTGLVAAPATKKLLAMAGLQDAYTSTRGNSKTMGNFIKAAFAALGKTYKFLTPDLWKELELSANVYEKNADFLTKASKKKL
ncbi:ribosomal protein S5 [Batrachochytrium salamandrivorans]|nr:ribosomal protein S5 [Batrachochytrium salamandrivorans]